MHRMRFCLALTLLTLPLLGQARKPEDVFAGRIVVMKRRLPTRFPSQEQFISAISRAKVEKLWAEKEGQDKGKWLFEYIAFFNRPLNDLQVTLRYYDITGGARRFLREDSTWLQQRGERMFGSNAILGAPEFEPNKRILMTIENRNQVLAQARFIIIGDGPRYSGRVQFTDEETKERSP